jgi:peptidoglycan/xylan/chitin deacetylase (PgdA/CDA1 family)
VSKLQRVHGSAFQGKQEIMKLYVRWLMSAAVVLLLCARVAGAASREIAITLDDAPREDTAHFDGATRTSKLLATLKRAEVAQIAFFCNPVRMDAAGAARIKAYADAGHLIANHSNTHADLHQVGVQDFLADIDTADHVLRGVANFRPWFRFPYLHEGKTVEVRDTLRSELKKRGLLSAYVTVDTYDWHMDRMFQDAIAAGKKVDFDRLRSAYVDLLADSVEFYDAVAIKKLGRSPRHVLLMHENDLAAMYLGDLVAQLRKNGWKIISPELAFSDPIASVEPDTLLLGQGRVMAIATTKGYSGPRGRWEDEDKLQQQFERRHVWE